MCQTTITMAKVPRAMFCMEDPGLRSKATHESIVVIPTEFYGRKLSIERSRVPACERASDRTLASDRRAVQLAPMAVVVVERLMDAQPVVPHDEHPDFPAQAAGERGLGDVLDQEFEDRCGLFRLQPLDAGGIGLVAIERPFAGARVGAHERVEAALHLAREIVGSVAMPLVWASLPMGLSTGAA